MVFKKRTYQGKPQMTKVKLALQMKMFLAQCRDDALMRTTADDLVSRYKVPRTVAEQELMRAKGNRHVG